MGSGEVGMSERDIKPWMRRAAEEGLNAWEGVAEEWSPEKPGPVDFVAEAIAANAPPVEEMYEALLMGLGATDERMPITHGAITSALLAYNTWLQREEIKPK